MFPGDRHSVYSVKIKEINPNNCLVSNKQNIDKLEQSLNAIIQRKDKNAKLLIELENSDDDMCLYIYSQKALKKIPDINHDSNTVSRKLIREINESYIFYNFSKKRLVIKFPSDKDTQYEVALLFMKFIFNKEEDSISELKEYCMDFDIFRKKKSYTQFYGKNFIDIRVRGIEVLDLLTGDKDRKIISSRKEGDIYDSINEIPYTKLICTVYLSFMTCSSEQKEINITLGYPNKTNIPVRQRAYQEEIYSILRKINLYKKNTEKESCFDFFVYLLNLHGKNIFEVDPYLTNKKFRKIFKFLQKRRLLKEEVSCESIICDQCEYIHLANLEKQSDNNMGYFCHEKGFNIVNEDSKLIRKQTSVNYFIDLIKKAQELHAHVLILTTIQTLCFTLAE